MVAQGEGLLSPNWAEEDRFSNNKVKFLVENIAVEFDKLLETLGYVREGLYYRVAKENTDTVAMVSHGGSSSAVFSHLLNLPFPFICEVLRNRLTSVTILTLKGEEGALISPRIEVMNDAGHINGIGPEYYGT